MPAGIELHCSDSPHTYSLVARKIIQGAVWGYGERHGPSASTGILGNSAVPATGTAAPSATPLPCTPTIFRAPSTVLLLLQDSRSGWPRQTPAPPRAPPAADFVVRNAHIIPCTLIRDAHVGITGACRTWLETPSSSSSSLRYAASGFSPRRYWTLAASHSLERRRATVPCESTVARKQETQDDREILHLGSLSSKRTLQANSSPEALEQ